MAPRLSGQTSFLVLFFVSLLGIERQKGLKNGKSRSHVGILKYGTWPFSFQLRLMQRVFSNANDINLDNDIPPLHEPQLHASSSPIPRIQIWLIET